MNNWIVAVAICSGMFISVLNNSSINTVLPKIALQFRTEIPEVQWLVIGYGLVSGALILPMGHLSDLVGRKRIYLTGFLISGLTTIMTSIAPRLTLAILFRGLQGVGGAICYDPSLDAIYKEGVTSGLKNAFVDGLGLALRVQAVLVIVAVLLTVAKGKERKIQKIDPLRT